MIAIKKDRVIFTRDIWEELRKNSNYSELIEDIEDRMELENAIEEHNKSGSKLGDFDMYDKTRMKKIKASKGTIKNELRD